MTKKNFSASINHKISFHFFLVLSAVFKDSRHFLIQPEVKPNPIVTSWHTLLPLDANNMYLVDHLSPTSVSTEQ